MNSKQFVILKINMPIFGTVSHFGKKFRFCIDPTIIMNGSLLVCQCNEPRAMRHLPCLSDALTS